ncbi:hypothetical protein ASPZODRAFT_102915 [Penicilliopsis zonata CBS 506.65]|uniref:Major facilitator superfamily (MFS) profile domain-containing protein n=1 Tax=Penicilliopsis zonata CBS 506.65 TaxID=1073090 RepID=A0A1L9S8R3_9EURO|nr:hypothetical protein ASPZODRAFT_102915 [Penicilliopsis zonata CBS 506.65]OJJ43552.1 hypothetical protein ASPZODRAFT_102915 [Penicilliopsis zonata CBS 506.65]
MADSEEPQVSPRVRWMLWTSFALLCYVQGVSELTLTVYLSTAAALFNGSVQYSTISVVESIISGASNLVYAKIADVFGRPLMLAGSLLFYILGVIVLSSAHNIATLCVGIVLYAFGNTGISFAIYLVTADLVPARWRCTISNVTLLPYVINFGIASKITARLVPLHWRWGIGMFAILVPVTAGPLAASLYFFSRQSNKTSTPPKRSLNKTVRALWQLDPLGLLLVTVGFGLLLLPLTIADEAPHGYASGYIIAMFVIGAVSLLLFPVAEWFLAFPAINLRRLVALGSSVDLLVAIAIAVADAMSVMISYTPAYNWVRVTFDWNVQDATYFLDAASLSVVIFGIVGGFVATVTGRYKWLTVFGGGVRFLALGLMYRYRGAGSSTFQIVFPQVLQGLGGAVMTANLLVACQIAVPHADVAMVTGLFVMCEGVADGIGSAIAGAIQGKLLGELTRSLSAVGASETLIQAIYDDGVLALADYPLGSTIRTATIEAWERNTHQLLIAALVIAGVNFLLCFFLQDRKLPDKHNCITDEKAGLPVLDDSI